MNLAVCVLLVGQIHVPLPEATSFDVSDLQARREFRGIGPGLDCKYRIQPYLQVAKDLQSLPEKDRVRTLASWARIESLAEPTIILTRMLIEKSDGTPLRRPLLGAPYVQLGGKVGDYPDEPLLFFQGVPFFAVSGYRVFGVPETASEYLQYALSVGRWRTTQYVVIEEQQLHSIAKALIRDRQPEPHGGTELHRWVMSQIGPPHPSKR